MQSDVKRTALRHAGRSVTVVAARAGGGWTLGDRTRLLDLSGSALVDSLSVVDGEHAVDTSLVMPSAGFDTAATMRAEREVLTRAGGAVGGCLWSTSGSTAIETAVATVCMALFGRELPDTIIVREGSYHGATYLARTLSARASCESRSIANTRVVVVPEHPRRETAAADLLERIRSASTGDTLVVLESVPTTGRHFHLGDDYLKTVMRSLAQDRIPVIFDEVASGSYRHGWFTLYELLDEHPPAATVLAKGLTCGRFPLALTLLQRDVADAMRSEPSKIPRFTAGLNDGSARLLIASFAAFDRVRTELPARLDLVSSLAGSLDGRTGMCVEHSPTTLRLGFDGGAAMSQVRAKLMQRKAWCYGGTAQFHDGERGFVVLCPPLDTPLAILSDLFGQFVRPGLT
jgi:hypothetical protein